MVLPFLSCNSNVNSFAFNRRSVCFGLSITLLAFGVTDTGWLEYELTNWPLSMVLPFFMEMAGLMSEAFNCPLLSSVTVTVHMA